MSSLVPAIDRAVRVLHLFKEGEQQEYGVSEISRLLNLNKSTVHNILNTLAHHQLLVQNEATRRYRLGPALAELGGLVRSQMDVRSLARPYLRHLMEETQSTIILGTLTETYITVIDKEEPLSDVRVATSVGLRLPFCAGACGKVFLAHLPDARVDALLQSPGLKQFTPTSITDPTAYKTALKQVQVQGYAVDDNEEYMQDVGAISVPIFAPMLGSNGSNAAKTIVAVITLLNFSSRLTPTTIEEYLAVMLEAAQDISHRLGLSLEGQNV